MNEPEESKEASLAPESKDVERIKGEIERTRTDLSSTINELETRLSPVQIRSVLRAELEHAEQRVRAMVSDQLGEAKSAVQGELVEARQVLQDGLDRAEEKLRRGLVDAKSAVKQDVSNAVQDAKRAVRAATLGKIEDLATHIGDKMNQTQDSLIDTVRQNPIPSAMVGAGLVWLLMNRSRSASNAMTRARSAVGGAAQQLTDSVNREVHGASEAVGHAVHDASESASQLLHRAKDTAQHWAGEASNAATGAADEARLGLRRAERGLQSTYRENPLALGAAALALGAVVGVALPRTEREDQILGEARDHVLHKAGDAAHQAVASVSQLAEAALEGVKQPAQQAASTNR